MFYLLHGTDSKKVRAKVGSTVASLLKREPNASHFRLTDETVTSDALAEYLGGQGLFAGKILVVLDRVFDDSTAKELVLDRVKDIASSDNIFIILEGELDAKTKKKLEKYAEKVQVFDQRPTTKDQRLKFNIFGLTDALGNRDKKKLWVKYQQALRSGSAPEELHGILFWQTKTLLLVAQKSTAGLKPFVVSKAKKFLNNWTEDELKTLSSQLVDVYHEARRGGPELEIGLEQFVLSL